MTCWLTAVAAAVAAVGCHHGVAVGIVEGEVTLDGKPLADGVIHFTPLDGQSPTQSAFISGGRFSKEVPLGRHRVQVSSVEVLPLRPGQAADSAGGRERVPEKYNTGSELEAEVKRGKNPLRLELKS